jgi:hypothetical protein
MAFPSRDQYENILAAKNVTDPLAIDSYISAYERFKRNDTSLTGIRLAQAKVLDAGIQKASREENVSKRTKLVLDMQQTFKVNRLKWQSKNKIKFCFHPKFDKSWKYK